jgi:hypothetical protein
MSSALLVCHEYSLNLISMLDVLIFSLLLIFPAMFDLGNSLVQGDASCGTYYLVMATLHVYGDNIKEALVATDSYPNMEL